MRIYCVQHDIVWENKPANFARVEALLTAAAPERDSLVLLPEMFSVGFSLNVAGVQEGPARDTEKFLSATAKKLGVFLLGGVVTSAPNNRGCNQAVVFAPGGEELARYSKMQLFTLGGEADHYEAGRAPLTFACGGFTIAPFICFDLRFPEHFREAARRGAQMFTVIASWPVARIQQWVTLLQARAIENQAYVAGVNRVGNDPRYVYNGRSVIINPRGEIIADAGNGETVVSAEADLTALLALRKELPFLADMRVA